MVLCRNLLIYSKVSFLLPTNLSGSLLMALAYSRSFLRAIAPSVSEIRARCSSVLWRRLTEHCISRVKPTRRGCRGGRRKLRTLTQHQTLQIDSSGSNFLSSDNLLRQEELSFTNAQVNYHNELIKALNIQIDTSENGTQNHQSFPWVQNDRSASSQTTTTSENRTYSK